MFSTIEGTHRKTGAGGRRLRSMVCVGLTTLLVCGRSDRW
jgi:hypothetical protein